MSRSVFVLASTLALSFSTAVFAEPDKGQQESRDALPGSATAHFLAVQRSGEAASSNEQYLSGKARAESYKRYVNSFSHPIPENYIQESFSNEGK